jgi:Flp pilus assembly protein TadG
MRMLRKFLHDDRGAVSHPRSRQPMRRAGVVAVRALGALAGDRAGAAAIFIGLTSMILLGFTALGTEAGYWYFTHRNLQNAADSAAMSAAVAFTASNTASNGAPTAGDKTQAIAEAKATAARYGFTDAQGSVTVTVNIPPTTGAYTTDNNAVEVIISEPQTLFLTAALKFGRTPLFATNPTQKVRAVANPGTNGNGCVVTLDRSDVIDLSLNGNTTVNLTGCDLYINSDAPNALNQVGNAAVTANAAFIYGGDSGNGDITTQVGPNCTAAPCAPYYGTAPINDPYAGVPPPYNVGSSCTAIPPITTGSSTVNLAPDSGGVVLFCGGWSPSGTIHLSPGLYVVWGGTFGCNGCTITGDNVTIFLTGTGTNYASMAFAGNGALNINAPTDAYVTANPTTKAIEGIAIYGDRNDPCTVTSGVRSCSLTSTFSGNATATVNGVIYLPDQNTIFNGNGTGGSPTCSQMISYTATFHGNSGFANNCVAYQNKTLGTGVLSVGAIPAHLVE